MANDFPSEVLKPGRCLICGRQADGNRFLVGFTMPIPEAQTVYQSQTCSFKVHIPGENKCGTSLDSPQWLLYTAWRDIVESFVRKEAGQPLNDLHEKILAEMTTG